MFRVPIVRQGPFSFACILITLNRDGCNVRTFGSSEAHVDIDDAARCFDMQRIAIDPSRFRSGKSAHKFPQPSSANLQDSY